jgi:hypothetical protein
MESKLRRQPVLMSLDQLAALDDGQIEQRLGERLRPLEIVERECGLDRLDPRIDRVVRLV